MIMQDQQVVYTGNKFRELSSAVGTVVAPVQNDPGKYVIDFGGDSYIMPETSLRPYQPSAKEDRGPQIIPVRRRRSDDDE